MCLSDRPFLSDENAHRIGIVGARSLGRTVISHSTARCRPREANAAHYKPANAAHYKPTTRAPQRASRPPGRTGVAELPIIVAAGEADDGAHVTVIGAEDGGG